MGGTGLRIIEHRRHTLRVKPGQHLSQAGVDLARAVGEGMGPFDLVVTSASRHWQKASGCCPIWTRYRSRRFRGR